MVFLSQWQNTNEYGDRILTGTAVTGHTCFYHSDSIVTVQQSLTPATLRPALTIASPSRTFPALPQVKAYCKGCRCCAPNTLFLPESETDSELFLPGKWDQQLEEMSRSWVLGLTSVTPWGSGKRLGGWVNGITTSWGSVWAALENLSPRQKETKQNWSGSNHRIAQGESSGQLKSQL